MTVREIVKQWLVEYGYDGLCGEGCGCPLNDLMSCDTYSALCEPGYKVECPDCRYFDTDECVGEPGCGCILPEKPQSSGNPGELSGKEHADDR